MMCTAGWLTQKVYPKLLRRKPECPNLLPCFTIWGTTNVYGLYCLVTQVRSAIAYVL